jgi:excisionase family DNA binding protein
METKGIQDKSTFEQLSETVLVLVKEISELKSIVSLQPTSKRRPIGVFEASKILCKQIGTIYNLTSADKIPFHKMGNQLYFYEDELLAHIENGKSQQK